MALTRVQADTAMVERCREPLTIAKLSTATDGTNPDLDEPYASALGYFGITPADRAHVQSSDLDTFDDALNDRFLDWAEIRVLKMCQLFWVSRPSREEWPDYKTDREYQLQYLGELIPQRLKDFAALHEQGGVPGVVELHRGIRHGLRMHRGRHRRGGGLDL